MHMHMYVQGHTHISGTHAYINSAQEFVPTQVCTISAFGLFFNDIFHERRVLLLYQAPTEPLLVLQSIRCCSGSA